MLSVYSKEFVSTCQSSGYCSLAIHSFADLISQFDWQESVFWLRLLWRIVIAIKIPKTNKFVFFPSVTETFKQ